MPRENDIVYEEIAVTNFVGGEPISMAIIVETSIDSGVWRQVEAPDIEMPYAVYLGKNRAVEFHQ